MVAFLRVGSRTRRPAHAWLGLGLAFYASGCSGHRFAGDEEPDTTVVLAQPSATPGGLGAPEINNGADGGAFGETSDDITWMDPASVSSTHATGEADTTMAETSSADTASETETYPEPSWDTVEPGQNGQTGETMGSADAGITPNSDSTDVTGGEPTGETSDGTQTAQPDREELIAALLGCDNDETVIVQGAELLNFETTPDTALHVGPLVMGSGGETLAAVLAEYHDGTGSYGLQWVNGADGTARALSATNPSASAWGGGVALAVQCFDAGRFEGIEFWMRGHTPAGTMEFGVLVSLTRSASVELEIRSEWTRYRVPFDRLRVEGRRHTAVGRSLRALVWSSHLRYMQSSRSDEGQPGSAAFEIAVDEIRLF